MFILKTKNFKSCLKRKIKRKIINTINTLLNNLLNNFFLQQKHFKSKVIVFLQLEALHNHRFQSFLNRES